MFHLIMWHVQENKIIIHVAAIKLIEFDQGIYHILDDNPA
jgi:hypothetical protein